MTIAAGANEIDALTMTVTGAVDLVADRRIRDGSPPRSGVSAGLEGWPMRALSGAGTDRPLAAGGGDLTEEVTAYVLDPEAVYGDDFPGETLRVLKENEQRKYGEYRTQRLILHHYRAWRDGEIDEFDRWLSSRATSAEPPLPAPA